MLSDDVMPTVTDFDVSAGAIDNFTKYVYVLPSLDWPDSGTIISPFNGPTVATVAQLYFCTPMCNLKIYTGVFTSYEATWHPRNILYCENHRLPHFVICPKNIFESEKPHRTGEI